MSNIKQLSTVVKELSDLRGLTELDNPAILKRLIGDQPLPKDSQGLDLMVENQELRRRLTEANVAIKKVLRQLTNQLDPLEVDQVVQQVMLTLDVSTNPGAYAAQFTESHLAYLAEGDSRLASQLAQALINWFESHDLQAATHWRTHLQNKD